MKESCVLRPVAEGVLVHESEWLKSNAIVVMGQAGALLIDPGVCGDEMVAIAKDLSDAGVDVVAGFATHPHWDHLLWHENFGAAPRYGTARCAAAVRHALADPGAKARIAERMIPPDIVDQVPLDLMGLVDGLPAEVGEIPWDGPRVRVLEHQAHAAGHAALFIEERGVLVAGDMLSDILIPFLDMNAADPTADYFAGLDLLAGVAGDVDAFVPGHGTVGGADDIQRRITQDRAYVNALHHGEDVNDPRLDPAAYGKDFLPGVHAMQTERVAQNP
jgi:glyoxylase-like metal-dependent hydrolase (beta-lactamase superfamily II)